MVIKHFNPAPFNLAGYSLLKVNSLPIISQDNLSALFQSKVNEVVIPISNDDDKKHGGTKLMGFVAFRLITPESIMVGNDELSKQYEVILTESNKNHASSIVNENLIKEIIPEKSHSPPPPPKEEKKNDLPSTKSLESQLPEALITVGIDLKTSVATTQQVELSIQPERNSLKPESSQQSSVGSQSTSLPQPQELLSIPTVAHPPTDQKLEITSSSSPDELSAVSAANEIQSAPSAPNQEKFEDSDTFNYTELYGENKKYPEPYLAGNVPNSVYQLRQQSFKKSGRFTYSVRYRNGPLGLTFDNTVGLRLLLLI